MAANDAGYPANNAIEALIAACLAEADRLGIDPSDLPFAPPAPVDIVDRVPTASAAQLIAEHTGHDEYILADAIVDHLGEAAGVRFTSGDRLAVVAIINRHRGH